jgi:cytoskeletal protein CcmA (bactofilin family)
MSIFRRDPPGRQAPAPTRGAASGEASAPAASPISRRGTTTAAVTLIAPGTRLDGAISGTTEVQIHGEVAGEVKVDGAVVVGADGCVSGPIAAQVVRVAGRVAGNLTAVELVEISAAANVDGDITAPRVVIAEGALFTGSIDMKGDPQPTRRSASPEPSLPQSAPAVRTSEAAGATTRSASSDAGSH